MLYKQKYAHKNNKKSRIIQCAWATIVQGLKQS